MPKSNTREMPQAPAKPTTNTVRKDAFNISTKTLEAKTADGTYSDNEKEMLNELKSLLIQLINNGKGS